jgi:hypothetical protein
MSPQKDAIWALIKAAGNVIFYTEGRGFEW